MEDMIAGSSEAIDNNLNQALAFTTSTMAKVSPNLLRRRRSPSPSTASVKQDSLLATGSSGGGGGNTSSSSGVSTGNRSDRYLSPGGAGGGGGGGGAGSDAEGKEKPLSDASSSSQKSTSDPSQLLVPGTDPNSADVALSKSPSTGSDIVCGTGKGSKGKIPNQAKKKSWYSVFYPSYKSRSADFKKLFKDVPDEERLLVGEKGEIIVSRWSLCLL